MIALFLAVLLAAAPRAGGRIQGSLVDSSGAALDDATLRIDDAASGNTIIRLHSKDGSFASQRLDPGVYNLTAWQRGFIAREESGVRVADGKTTDAGTISLSPPDCDAPGVICDTFLTADMPAPPSVRKEFDLVLAEGVNSKFENTDLRFVKDGDNLFLVPANGARISTESTPSVPKLRLDGRGPEVSFYVHHANGAVSHVYLLNEIDRNATEVRLWTVTRPR